LLLSVCGLLGTAQGLDVQVRGKFQTAGTGRMSILFGPIV
jgi:hypothetical protein